MEQSDEPRSFRSEVRYRIVFKKPAPRHFAGVLAFLRVVLRKLDLLFLTLYVQRLLPFGGLYKSNKQGLRETK